MSTKDNTPTIHNLPGLSAIAYRIGDYGSFNRRMWAHLTKKLRSEIPALSRLTTRDRDDAGIALLDAWAIVADVLTFYQERIANEGYLRTATERQSIVELTRTIGYELHPGVAASTYLAFTVDETPGGPREALIPIGTGIMSVPSSLDELPQTFETGEDFLARVEWNAFKPRSAKPQVISRIAGGSAWKLQVDGEAKNGQPVYLYLKGIDTQLKPGDRLLLMDGEDANTTGFLLKLETVESVATAGYTRVSWFKGEEQELQSPFKGNEGEIFTYQTPRVFAFRQKASLFGHNAPAWKDYGPLVERDIFQIGLDLKKLQPDDPQKTQEQWKGSEQIGLFNADINCLISTDRYLIAGTAGSGIFRRVLDNTETQWVSANNGLINPIAGVASFHVRSLAIDVKNNYLYAGTAGGGVFRSLNNGDSWFPIPFPRINRPRSIILLNKVVHALTVYDKGNNHYILAGTDTGIFRTNYEDTNPIWKGTKANEFKGELSGKSVYSLLTIEADIGTAIIDNSAVSGDSSKIQTIIVKDIYGKINEVTSIRIGSKEIQVSKIEKNELTINTVFDELKAGERIFFKSSKQIYILAGTDNGIYCSADGGDSWFELGLQNKKDKIIYSLAAYNAGEKFYIFAGATGKIYRSEDLRSSWEKKIELSNDESMDIKKGKPRIGSLMAEKKEAPNFVLFAATEVGVFYSEDNGENWEPINRDLPTRNVTSLVTTDKATNPEEKKVRLFAGTRLSRFGEDEWANFEILEPHIDLDTLYPQILQNSWIALVRNKEVKGYRVEDVLKVLRTDFGLDNEVTRITTDAVVDELKYFELRTTEVLIQSDLIELAQKPFSVETRQHQIFGDPIRENEIVLNEYVAGLSPGKRLIVSGKRMSIEVSDIGGAFYQKLGDTSWLPINTNLLAQEVQVFALNPDSKYLFSGTQNGVFKLELDSLPSDGSQLESEWQVIENNGLTNTNIKALAVTSNNQLVAGTPTGIFIRDESSVEWKSKLNDKQVRSIALLDNDILLAGTSNGLFLSNDAGEKWQSAGLNNVDIQALAVGSRRGGRVEIYAGTANDGVFLSVQDGLSWQQVSQTRSLKTAVRVKGRFVTGVSPALTKLLSTSFLGRTPAKFSFMNIAGRNIEVLNVREEDNTVELAEAVGGDVPEESLATINNGLINQNVTALAVDGDQVFAGTAGSGIFYSDDSGKTWRSLSSQPDDLNIRCLAAHSEENLLLAGTASGGVFLSQNRGASWQALTLGLSSVDIQTVAIAKKKNSDDLHLFAGGLGILQSHDNLEQVNVRVGDRLQLMKPPVLSPPELQPKPKDADPDAEVIDPDHPDTLWRWSGRDRDGFEGYLDAPRKRIILHPAAEEEEEIVSEFAVVQTAPTDQQVPLLKLKEPLQNSYDPATVKILANVVPATHGETVEQTLGSGDALTANQSFVLGQLPLTYVAADTPSGAKSTLEVRINDILWKEAERLYGLNDRAENYVVRHDYEGNAILTFGDGEQGVRLPTGQENVRAKYRYGLGLGGNLGAGSLSLLKTSPPGIKAAINPVPATGGAEPETKDTAREKAPRTVRTLERIVSLQDFEDFARGFAGIGKALATPIRQGGTQTVHITVAGLGGATVEPTSSLYESLVAAIDAARDPFQVVVQVDSYTKILFNLEAKIVVNARYEAEKVLEQLQSDLFQYFSFPQRQFGQPVTTSEIIARIQGIEGVEATDLDRLYLQGQARLLEPTLTAMPAQWDETTNLIQPAQLLLLNPKGLTLTPVPTL